MAGGFAGSGFLRRGGRRRIGAIASVAKIKDLLGATSIPESVVDALLDGASATWLIGENADIVAGDLVLCHPTLGTEEVRALVSPALDGGGWRISVVAHDRPGLLAQLAGTLAGHGLSIQSVSANAWAALGIAVMRLVVTDPAAATRQSAGWDAVGADLRAVLGRQEPEPAPPGWQPVPPVKVSTQPEHGGLTFVRVEAPDRVGLLWAIARWMADHGCNIEVARVATAYGLADCSFVIAGTLESTALARHLSGTEPTLKRRPGRELARAIEIATTPTRLAVDGLQRALGAVSSAAAGVGRRLRRR